MIKPLTSLRFFFALMVFVSHLLFLEYSESKASNWIFSSAFREGYIGVSFFFILSGFILAYNYQESILKNQKSKKTFYIARIARIFPLHVLTFLLALPLSYKIFFENKTLWFGRALTNISLTQSFIPFREIYFSFNLPSWSISDEMFFYLAFPFLILLIPNFKHFKTFIILSIVALVPLLTFIIPDNYYHQIFYIHPFIRIVDFIVGIIVFNIYRSCSTKVFKISYDFLEISALILLLIFFLCHQWIPQVALYSFYYWLPMSYLIFAFSYQKGKISKLLSKEIFIHLGEISFGFYMFHWLIIQYFLSVNSKLLNIESDAIVTIIIFFISLIISHLSFIYFEKPMNKYVKKILDYKKPIPKITEN